nr:hypothetical protein [Aliagarivorans taiwanensis]
MDRLTVMTKGRKGTFDTHYGCIEFTHTKKPLGSLEHRLYFDESVMMFRATEALARADLISCQRNRHMLVAND